MEVGRWTTEWHPDRSLRGRQKLRERERERGRETTWWRIEERYGQGVPKTDRDERCLKRLSANRG